MRDVKIYGDPNPDFTIIILLTQEELRRIKEIIALLKEFKEHTDKLGREKDVIIRLILPVFDYFQTDILAINEHDSGMIKQLKIHMLTKLKTRYSASQKEYLSYCTYLDPVAV